MAQVELLKALVIVTWLGQIPQHLSRQEFHLVELVGAVVEDLPAFFLSWEPLRQGACRMQFSILWDTTVAEAGWAMDFLRPRISLEQWPRPGPYLIMLWHAARTLHPSPIVSNLFLYCLYCLYCFYRNHGGFPHDSNVDQPKHNRGYNNPACVGFLGYPPFQLKYVQSNAV